MTTTRTNGRRTAFSAVEAGDSRQADRTILARIETAPPTSEAGEAGGVEIRTSGAIPDAERRVAERLAQITAHSPSRAGLFRSVYYGKPSKAGAVKAKCQDCCCWQVERIKDCSSVTCPLWRVRPYQSALSRRTQASGKRFWRRTTAARVKTAEAA